MCRLERERERVNIGRGFLGATVIFGNVTVRGESRDPTPPHPRNDPFARLVGS